LVSVAVRPGKVDTAVCFPVDTLDTVTDTGGASSQMQAQIRQLAGTAQMLPEDVASFSKAHEEGNLVAPEESGHVIAALALNASPEFTGQFISWDSEKCRDFWDSK
jgi:hypothetical protein